MSNERSVLATSHDGQILATGGHGPFGSSKSKPQRAIHFWETATGRRIGELHSDRAGVTSLAFTTDGKQLISGMSDGTVLTWNLPPTKSQPN